MRQMRRPFTRFDLWLATLVSFVLATATGSFAAGPTSQPVPLDSGLAPGDVARRSYLDYARECIDLLMEYGTDRYGPVKLPILVNILDVRSRDCPENPLPLDESVRVGRRERRAPAGANLYADQPTLRAMCELGRLTGDERYKAFAARNIQVYLDRLVDEKGFIWWGWHRHYDVFKDEMTGHLGNHHEIHFQQALWPLLWEVDREAVTREIQALWQWHVIDKTTGEINRHDDGGPGCDFAFTAGELAGAFAFLNSRTGERIWLDRAWLLVEYYWQRRNPSTDLFPTRPNAGSDRFDGSHFDTSSVGYFCHSLMKIHECTGDQRFLDRAVACLKAYERFAWDASSGRYWASLKLDGTPETGPRTVGGYAQYEPHGHVDLWQPYVAGYEAPVYAAQSYALAAGLRGDDVLTTAARRWADVLVKDWPPRRCTTPSWYGWYCETWAPHGTYATLYGSAISFLLQMHALTGEDRYLAFARAAADEAIAKLYYRGLFRGHPCKPYYEAIDGVGNLLVALLQLHEATQANRPPTASPRNAAIRLANW